MHNHELTTVRFLASIKTILRLEREGYNLIRHISTDCYEALVTDPEQFEKILKKVSETSL